MSKVSKSPQLSILDIELNRTIAQYNNTRKAVDPLATPIHFWRFWGFPGPIAYQIALMENEPFSYLAEFVPQKLDQKIMLMIDKASRVQCLRSDSQYARHCKADLMLYRNALGVKMQLLLDEFDCPDMAILSVKGKEILKQVKELSMQHLEQAS